MHTLKYVGIMDDDSHRELSDALVRIQMLQPLEKRRRITFTMCACMYPCAQKVRGSYASIRRNLSKVRGHMYVELADACLRIWGEE